MRKKYTRDQLYDFVWRADTHEKIEIAKSWITKNVDDNELWNDLMVELSTMSRDLYAADNGRRRLI